MTGTENLKIEYLNITELKEHDNNAKLHPQEQVEQIKASIEAFGMNDPIAIWKDNIIIEGHGRLYACRELGIEQVPVIRLDRLSDEERRAYMLAHNQTTMNSGWDFEKLDLEIQSLQDFDMVKFGFDGGMQEPNPDDNIEIKEDEYNFEEPAETRAKKGDIFKLGEHRLICGDSTDAETVRRLTEGAQIDLVLTDPPYNVDIENVRRPNSSHDGEGILNDHMSEADFIAFLTKALEAADESLKAGGAFYIWYAGLHHMEFESAIRNIKAWKISEILIWVKSHFVMGRNSDYQWQHEPCFYGWKNGAAHYFTDSRTEATVIEEDSVKLSTLKKGELIDLLEKYMGIKQSTTILRADKPPTADLHPTVKPQKLITELIKNSSKRGENVLDLFGGSGSTLIACEQLGRKCYICELDPKFADVIIDRWEKFTGQQAQQITT